MFNGVGKRRLTYKDWTNVMRDEIKMFSPFCAYANKRHRCNKTSFHCNFKCIFNDCTSTCKISHNVDDGVMFRYALSGEIKHAKCERKGVRQTSSKKKSTLNEIQKFSYPVPQILTR